ncbi:MAG: protein adenylyltransferase Fic [Gammaproteobacteria bacterium]
MPSWSPTKPYNDLPLLPPPIELETKTTLKHCIGARAALSGLQQATGLIPNPAILINTIPLLEAQASSEIENVVTTADALFKYAQMDEQADPATKEALRYRTALHQGFQILRERPVSTGTAERVCGIIKGRSMMVRRVPGTALVGVSGGEIVYTPPVGESVIRDKLANWERFIHDQPDIDPLILMAVAHYQFEAIHPFTDGNGRTGRILNLLLMVEQGLLDVPILYLSRYVLRYRAEYYQRLLDVTREGEWEPWIVYMLRGIAETAAWTTAKIHAVRDLMRHTIDYVRQQRPKIYSRELLDLIFIQPYCRIQNLVDEGVAQRQTASSYLKSLVDIGVLREIKVGREKLFLHPKLARLLTQESHDFGPYTESPGRNQV